MFSHLTFHRCMDVTVPVRRDAPQWARRTGLAAGAVLGALVSLGVPYLSGAGMLVQAVDMRFGPSDASADVLGIALSRVAIALPLGDVSMRAALVSIVCAAVAVAFWVRTALAVVASLRPPAHARRTPQDVAHEPVAAIGAVVIVLCAPPFFVLAKGAAGGGVALMLLSLWTWCASCVLREPSDGRAALAASFLAGLAVANNPPVGAVVAPCGAAIWGFGVARKAKWAPVAPVFFAVGLVLLLAGAVLPAGLTATLSGWWDVLSLGVLRRAVSQVNLQTWLEVALAVGESLGVVACLLAAIGWGVLAWRASGMAGMMLFIGWAALMIAAASPAGEARAEIALGLAVAASVVPLAVGVLHFANKLGRAHVAGAVTLAVMAAVAPAFSGGRARWWPDGRLPVRVLMRAHRDLAPRSVVDPGSAPVDVMLRYGAALGLRPDLTIDPARK